MANTTVKGKFNVVAENGDVQTIYPKTTGDQVLVDRSSNASVIPNDVANFQHIVNKMGALALKSKVETSDFTTGTMISSLEDLKSNTDTGKIADATVVKNIESRVDTLENSNLVTVDELDAGLATKPDTEINDSVTSTSLTWSSKKLSDQLTTLNSKSDLLDTRVASLITHNNDTEGNSELLDIRTGADGTVYASAGDAVRNQFSSIASAFEYIEPENKLNLDTITENTIINISGVETANDTCYTSDFIKAAYGDMVILALKKDRTFYCGELINLTRVSMYDQNRQFISTSVMNIQNFAITEQNTAFIRVSVPNGTLNYDIVSVNLNTAPTSESISEYFTPYFKILVPELESINEQVQENVNQKKMHNKIRKLNRLKK